MGKDFEIDRGYVDTEELINKIDKLEEKLLWYKSFFDNATDAVFIVQPDSWDVLDANDYAATLLGIPRNELVGAIMPQFRRIFKSLKKSSSPVVLSELSIDTPSNPNLMVEVSARFFRHYNTDLIYAIARDVSEQHALTDKMVQADKLVLLGQLSAGVAHEIRNPLAAINLNLQLMKRNLGEENKNYNYIKNAMSGAERISRIVELTLNFSRPATPKIEKIHVNKIIPASLEMVKPVIKRKDIDIKIELDDNLPDTAADSKQIQQVFINLLTNASDAIKDKGTISITTYVEMGIKASENNYVVTAVKDTGCGIPSEDLQKIFNPFFTRKTEGTGLGLPITQKILHQHNGVIDVESNLNEGTCFYVKLPIL